MSNKENTDQNACPKDGIEVDKVVNAGYEQEDEYDSDKTVDFAEFIPTKKIKKEDNKIIVFMDDLDATENGRQNINFCRCCLLNFSKIGGDTTPLNMQNEVFLYENQQITFLDGYFNVNNDSVEEFPGLPTSEVQICISCMVQMESAYVFKKLCQRTNVILRQKYSPKESSDQIVSEPVEMDTNCDKAVESSIIEEHLSEDNAASGQETRAKNNTDIPVVKNESLRMSLRKRKMFIKLNKPDNKIYKTKKVLLVDNETKHLKKTYPCNHCEKEFSSKYIRSRHNNSIHLKITYTCGNCSKIFAAARNLLRHRKSEHLNLRYTCDFCSRLYKNRKSIIAHMESKHLNKYN